MPTVLHCENITHFLKNCKKCLHEKQQNINRSVLSLCFLRIDFFFVVRVSIFLLEPKIVGDPSV